MPSKYGIPFPSGRDPASRRRPVSSAARLLGAASVLLASAAQLPAQTPAQPANPPASASAGSTTTTAAATNDDTVVLDEFVVQGYRDSLSESLAIKRENVQAVDSVVAEDIGKFPDNNVVEALQRVSGVQVTNRGRGEVSSVTIRGLPDVTTTVNNRNIFTASGRSVALQDIPAALLNRVDVYKTRSSDLIESGIAGVIDVRTQRPFDFDDQRVVLTARGVYQEQADTFGPNLSALYSNRWELDGGGEFGALVSLSYVRTEWRDQAVTAGAMVPFMTDQPLAGWVPYQRIFPDPDPTTGLPFWQAGLDDGLPDEPGSTLTMFGETVPYVLSRDAVFASDWTGDRKRPAANLALQFKPNERATYTFETFYNGYRETTFNDLHFVFVDWWGALGPNPSADIDLYPNSNVIKARRNIGFPYGFMSGDYFRARTDSILYGLNAKWELSDALTLEADVAYQDSDFESSFFAVRTDRVHRMIDVDFDRGGGITALWYEDDPATAGVDESDLTNPALWNIAQMYDNGDYSKGDAFTAMIDGDYKFEEGFFKVVSFGARWDERGASQGQRRQNSTRSDALARDALGLPLTTFSEEAMYVNRGFFDGRTDFPSQWVVFNGDYIPAHADEIRQLYNDTLYATPVDAGRRLLLSDQLVLRETFDVTETTTSAYVMTNFEIPLGDSRIDGQFGFRYVNVENDSTFTDLGAAGFPQARGSSSRDELLPSLAVRYDLTGNLRLRFSYGETLRPPNFNDINPTINYVEDVTNIGYGTASGGNPNLQATTSKNYDLSLEYFFGDASAVYGTVFKRDIDGLVVPFRRRVTATPPPRTTPYDYILSQPFNASDGELTGFEGGIVYFPENLPGILDGFGIQASFTALDSEQNIPLTDNAGNVIGQDTGPFFGVSDTSYNIVLAYEKNRVSVRLGYVWREDFLARNEAALFANPLGIYRKPEESLDFQLTWQVRDNLGITFDATNLTEELQQEYYRYERNNFGSVILSREFAVGVRYSF